MTRPEPPVGSGPSFAPGDFRVPAVPLLEHRPHDRIRELYLYEEPALLAAIGRGDRGEAIRIINYVLVHIYSAGQERSDLLKGLLLELVVMMSRAAVDGHRPRHAARRNGEPGHRRPGRDRFRDGSARAAPIGEDGPETAELADDGLPALSQETPR